MMMQVSSGDLVAANSTANSIAQYSIGADGALSLVSQSSSSADSSPAALIPGKNGNVLSISKDAVPKWRIFRRNRTISR